VAVARQGDKGRTAVGEINQVLPEAQRERPLGAQLERETWAAGVAPEACGEAYATAETLAPFVLERGEAGGDGAAGGGNLGDSGCSSDPSDPSAVLCQGLAQVEQTAHGPVLTLADGSTLTWQLETFDAGSLLETSSVVVEYSLKNIIICPFCGSAPAWSLSVVRAEDITQDLLYWTYSSRGSGMAGAAELLGVSLTQEPACSNPSAADCYLRVERDYYDTIVGEPLDQRLKYGVSVDLDVPAGVFTFYAAEFGETGTFDELCADGRGLAYGGTVLIVRK
jgi:hypothetical protein